MCVEVALPFEAFPTHQAQVGSLPRVSHPVSLHVALPIESPAAVCALVRPFPRVDSHVQSQSSALSELCAAFLTLVRLLSGVDSQVILQMTRLFEAFGADGTGVSSLPAEVVQVFVRSKTHASFNAQVGVLPFLCPRSRRCEHLNPVSIQHTFCSLTIFTLVDRAEGQTSSAQSRQVVAFSSLFLCCVKCLVGHNRVVAGAKRTRFIVDTPL